MFGEATQTVDYASLSDEGFEIEYMSEEEIEAFAGERIGRPIVVVGAATGTDTHSVGIDAMLNLKGFPRPPRPGGLQVVRDAQPRQPGAQQRARVQAIDLGADAILVSQTVTQQNLHIANLTELVEIVEAEGRRRQLILTCGGPRVSNELAKELGFDAGFSKGTYPYHVASFIVRELAARLDGAGEPDGGAGAGAAGAGAAAGAASPGAPAAASVNGAAAANGAGDPGTDG